MLLLSKIKQFNLQNDATTFVCGIFVEKIFTFNGPIKNFFNTNNSVTTDFSNILELQYNQEINNTEGWVLEFKASICNLEYTFSRTFNALLNSDIPSSWLLYGVTDNGIVCGIPLSRKDQDELQLKLGNIARQYTPPAEKNYTIKFIPVKGFPNDNTTTTTTTIIKTTKKNIKEKRK